MFLVKKPESDGGWTFTFKLTGEEFAGLDATELSILFSPTRVGAERFPTSSVALVMFSFARRVELRALEERFEAKIQGGEEDNEREV